MWSITCACVYMCGVCAYACFVCVVSILDPELAHALARIAHDYADDEWLSILPRLDDFEPHNCPERTQTIVDHTHAHTHTDTDTDTDTAPALAPFVPCSCRFATPAYIKVRLSPSTRDVPLSLFTARSGGGATRDATVAAVG